jgi:hypothetical protein
MSTIWQPVFERGFFSSTIFGWGAAANQSLNFTGAALRFRAA